MTTPGSKLSRRALLLSAAAPALSACSSATLFNAVVPADSGAVLLREDVAYGPHSRHRLDLYGPAGAAFASTAPAGRPRGLPVVLFIYGGSWTGGSRSDYGFVGKALASQGFLVAIADYRLVPEIRYPVFVEDGAMALAWLSRNIAAQGGDPGRIVVMGHSAGAYNAMMLALDRGFAREQGLSGRPIRAGVGLAGPYDFLPLDVAATRDAFGQWPRLEETQPINHVRRDAPPMLLATGAADTTVYPRNTAALARRLRAVGATVQEKTYPEIGHAGIVTAFAPPFRSNAPVLADVSAFIRRHAG